MSPSDLLNIILITGFLVITACVVTATYYFVQALKSITSLSEDVREKLKMKLLTAVPSILVALAARIFKRRG